MKKAIRIPVATGENNYTSFEFRELCERRAARYLVPDVFRANGFSETLEIAHLAEMPRCEDGQFRIPARPGHGMTLAAGAERTYRLS